MRIPPFHACLFFLLCLALSPLRAGADEPTMLLTYHHENYQTDIALAIMREAYRRIGYRMMIQELPRGRALHSANQGHMDADLMRAEVSEAVYPNMVRVPEPLLYSEVHAFVTGPAAPVQHWEDLKPYSVCALTGMLAVEQRLVGVRVSLADDIPRIVHMLSAKRCAYAILPNAVWLDIERLKIPAIRSLDPPLERIVLYHYVHRRHANLVPALTESLKQMRADGFIDKLYAELDERVRNAKTKAQFHG